MRSTRYTVGSGISSVGTRASKHSPTMDIFWSGTSCRRLVGLGTHGASLLLRSMHTPVMLMLRFVGERGEILEETTDRVLASRPIRGPQILCPGVLRGLV